METVQHTNTLEMHQRITIQMSAALPPLFDLFQAAPTIDAIIRMVTMIAMMPSITHTIPSKTVTAFRKN